MSEPWNYFNYFTEIEEHFQQARGTGLFLLSPLDWALIESWKNSGVPLEAVLRGVDAAFEKWHAKKKKLQQVNSIAYCTQAVYAEAQIMAGVAPARPANAAIEAPFSLEELRAHLQRSRQELVERGEAYGEVAASLGRIVEEVEVHYGQLEDLERRLTALEEKLSAIVRATQTEDQLLAARRELENSLRPYRGKMTADQLSMLERQYLDRRLFEEAGLPRLSLFYIR
jgi:DNA repair ATPase RecN